MSIATPSATHDINDLIPKVELHCHVEGTLRPATVAELARKAGRPLPVDDPPVGRARHRHRDGARCAARSGSRYES